MPDFRLRNLERYRTGGSRDRMKLSMPLPKSASGMVNQHCPNEDCAPRVFQLGDVVEGFSPPDNTDTYYRREPHTNGVTCPYCGHDDDDQEFIHPEDIKAIEKELFWAAKKDISDILGEMASDFNRKTSRNDLFSINLDVSPDRSPRPVAYRRDLLRGLTCNCCGRAYGVYAIGLFCPDCGSPNLAVHFSRELELINRQIDMAEQMKRDDTNDEELAYRLLGNAHEDVLTAFETYQKTTYRYLVHKRIPEQAEALCNKKATANRFQNIEKSRKLYAGLGIDPFEALDEDDLKFLRLNIEKRHVIGHNLSMADESYIKNNQSELEGETVHLMGEDIHRFVGISAMIVRRLEVELRIQDGCQ